MILPAAILSTSIMQEAASKVTRWYYRVRTLEATVTAYDKIEFPGKTASGHKGIVGQSIACSRSIPFGTVASSPAFGRRVCDDRLATKFDTRFDLFMDTPAEALAWGKRRIIITLEYPETKGGASK